MSTTEPQPTVRETIAAFFAGPEVPDKALLGPCLCPEAELEEPEAT
jgi:hypothetical protein